MLQRNVKPKGVYGTHLCAHRLCATAMIRCIRLPSTRPCHFTRNPVEAQNPSRNLREQRSINHTTLSARPVRHLRPPVDAESLSRECRMPRSNPAKCRSRGRRPLGVSKICSYAVVRGSTVYQRLISSQRVMRRRNHKVKSRSGEEDLLIVGSPSSLFSIPNAPSLIRKLT